MTAIIMTLLLMTVNTSGQSAQTAADERPAGGSAERTLLRAGHIGAAHGAKGQSPCKKYDNGKLFHHDTPKCFRHHLSAGAMNSYQSTSKTERPDSAGCAAYQSSSFF